METKLFEIRDRATMIVVMATRMSVDDPSEEWLLERAGFGSATSCRHFIVMSDGLPPGDGIEMIYFPATWRDRTHKIAHQWMVEKWEELPTGSVIDVEFILGETKTPKLSERVTSTTNGVRS